MKQVRIGVLGIGRGRSMIDYTKKANNARLVAICDFWAEGLLNTMEQINDDSITYYEAFDEFIKHDMDAVVLANYANEHAPYAIKALQAGLHVFSEVLPVQNMKEAVELVEEIEKHDLIYAYGENYCYMPATREMKRLYKLGKLGEFEYGEGEYIHNCAPIWADITRGDKNHWRNHQYATFYSTHSIGPLIHITSLRPIKVSGFETKYNERVRRMGKLGAPAGLEIITLENGAILKSVHGDLDKNSIWYSIYGSKGRIESAREDALQKHIERVYLNLDQDENSYDFTPTTYEPKDELHETAHDYGHGGSDFYTIYNFCEKVLGNPEADTIDIYEAFDMFFPGHFAYRSILNGGIPVDIPNFRNKEDREAFREDIFCTDPKVAKDKVWPCYSKGNPIIADEIYEEIEAVWKKNNQ